MKASAAALRSPAASAAADLATVSRMPSAAFGCGAAASTSENSVGSYSTSAFTRSGRRSAASSATAPPYEWPTSANGDPARANTGSSMATSSCSVSVRAVGQAGPRPAP